MRVFNLQGSEIIFILLLALVVLGPEKLPGAIKRAMQTYAELRKLGTGFQQEFRSAIDEPMREMRETADLIKDQVDPAKVAAEAERSAEAAAAADLADAEPIATDEPAADRVPTEIEGDEFDDPFDDPSEEPVEAEADVVPNDSSDDSVSDAANEPADEPMEESA